LWCYLGENVGVGVMMWSLYKVFICSVLYWVNVISSCYICVGVGVVYGYGRMWVVELFEWLLYIVYYSSLIGYGV